MFQLSEKDDVTFLGRPKAAATEANYSPGIPFPIPLKEDQLVDADAETQNFAIQATLVSSARALVTDSNHIKLLRSRGFYGFVPQEEHGTTIQQDEMQRHVDTDDDEAVGEVDWSEEPENSRLLSNESKQLYLTDVEILFLLHGLGCLNIKLPNPTKSEIDEKITDPLRLWFYLCSGTRLPSPAIHPTRARREVIRFSDMERGLLRRYAAYLYYRARGWVVRPGLALGGVHFLLYAQGPELRHAAFGVIVDRAENDGQQLTCAAMATHVRVIHSVGKRLILCRVSLPEVGTYEDCPWDAIRESTVMEALVDHWNPSCR